MEAEQTPTANPYASMPQSVRIESAKTVIAQAISGASLSYGLTMPEAVMAAEAALADLQRNMLAFMASQYQQLATAEQSSREPEPEAAQGTK